METDRTPDVDLVDASLLIEHAPDGMAVVDGGGRLLLVNSKLEKLFGYDRSELIGHHVEILVPEEFRSVHQGHRSGFTKQPSARSMGSGLDLFGRRADGTEFPVEIALSPVATRHGPGVVATIRDVTDRVKAQAHANAVLHTIDATHDAVFMFSPDSLLFTYVNRGAVGLLEYEPDELLTMTTTDILPDFDEPSFRALLKPVLQASAESHTLTTTYRRKSGSEVPVDVVIEFPPPASPGDRRLVVAVARDITARLAVEEARDRSTRWLAVLAEVRAGLVNELPVDEALGLICSKAAQLLDAESISILTLDSLDENTSDRLEHAFAGEMVVDEAGGEILVPIVSDTKTKAVLAVTLRPQGPLASEDVDGLTSFAAEAGSALTLSAARASRMQLRVLEDRERLARDLHDLVIQRIFAAGLRLQSVQSLVAQPEIAERIAESVGQLDDTITELRNAIFRLNNPEVVEVGRRLKAIVEEANDQLGFRLDFSPRGDIESLPDEVVEQLLAAVTEALTNMTRHAQAVKGRVRLDVHDASVVMTVSDDGVGFDKSSAAQGNGLANLEARAASLGGSVEIETGLDQGTTITWRVPLPAS